VYVEVSLRPSFESLALALKAKSLALTVKSLLTTLKEVNVQLSPPGGPDTSYSLELFVYLRLIIGILSLCLHIRSSDNLATFQSRLKSHLFSSAYHV